MTTPQSSPTADQVVAAPTYLADIRFFFRPQDVEHMAAKGIDLGTYDGVKTSALSIYAQTAPPNPQMPPDTAGHWSAERSQTFKNWIVNGYPLGTATPPAPAPPAAQPPARLRKEVTALSDPEFQLLTTAFTGMMARDPSAPDSYFALAGQHGLPRRWCLHHEDRFNPWHRQYLLDFEDALRSVPGCAQVTLPYWDISTALPERLQHPPFDRYVLPADPGAAATPHPVTGFFPYTTQRYPLATIAQNLKDFGVLDDITTSLKQSLWGSFNVSGYQDFSIQAHDGGHGSIGPTMGNQDVSSFDPVFWFFHCNIDRLWLSWQTRVHGTTLTGFRTTLGTDTDWLTTPFNALPPFSRTADQTIETEVSYDRLDLVSPAEGALENLSGSIDAARTFAFRSSDPVSVRVKGIDRLNIPGSFVVSLLADGEPVAKRYFFQPDDPRRCATCVKHGIVNIDFRMTQDQLLDRTLSVRIDVPGHAGIGTAFPLAQAGNPTVNARLLVQEA
ncbi:tyrosinase family protein [Kitasatospora brasiliensis]|uniref:tyrosinase family protein n=1 Tax=Kitasatospora brasiliensis TaxID=3058040 RepID=UPI00292F36AF|nr:tyrosinase family protein [Kitasatospora sp. K002]